MAAAHLDALIGGLQASSVEWRNNKSTISNQAIYLHTLQQLEDAVASLTADAVQEVVSKGVASNLVALAIEHGLLGMLPWSSLSVWTDVLSSLMIAVKDETSLSHLIPELWENVVRLSKDYSGSSSPTCTPALCACLKILQILLSYFPIELAAQRKHLPHSVKTVSVTSRVCGLNASPWIVRNVKQAPPSRAAGDAATAGLRWLHHDFLTYFRRGAASTEYAVREAAMEAIRVTLELGVAVDSSTAHQLLDTLMTASADVTCTSLKLQQDAGAAVGYLLAFFQTNCSLVSTQQLMSPRALSAVRWSFFGGATAAEADRVVRSIFSPQMARTTQHTLAVALAKLFTMCVAPHSVDAALRSAFVLLVPVQRDNRAYMPWLLAKAIELWVRQLPCNALREGIMACLRNYVQRVHEDRAIAHTALIALRDTVPLLASARNITNDLVEDMMAVAEVHPSFVGLISDVMGALTEHNPLFVRRLLQSLTAEDGGGGFGGAMPTSNTQQLLSIRALLAAPAEVQASPVVLSPVLATLVYLRAESVAVPLTESHYRRMEYYVLLSQLLRAHHGHRISAALRKKMRDTQNGFLSLLVSNPARSAGYLRAASAMCSFLLDVPDLTTPERTLCIGLLEAQLVDGGLASAAASPAASAALLIKLKSEVYGVLSAQAWPSCVDEGSLRWLVTQALNDLEGISEAGVAVALEDAELFPPPTAVLMTESRRLVPLHNQQAQAELGRRAAELIAWGIEHFGDRDVPFCDDVLQRVQRLGAGVPPPSSSPEAAVVAAARALQWNVLCLLYTIQRRALRGFRAERGAWRSHIGEHTARWQPLVTSWSTADVLDIKVLAAKVLGLLLCLTGKVDDYTTSVFRMNAAASLATALPSEAILTLSEAHAYHGEALDAAAATLPMATSFMSDFLKRHGIFGNPCSMQTVVVMISYIRVAMVFPSSTETALATALVSTLLAPMRTGIDPLVLHLLLVLFSLLPLSLPTHEALADLARAALHHAVSLKRGQPLDTGGDEVGLQLVYRTVVNARETDWSMTRRVVVQRLLEVLNASSLVPCDAVSTAQVQHAPQAQSVVRVPLSDAVARGIAEMWCLAVERGGSAHQLSLTSVAALADAATSRATRAAWLAVGKATLRAERTAAELQGHLHNMQRVLQGRPPDMSSGLSFSADPATSGGEGAPQSSDDGEADGRIAREASYREFGQESMFSPAEASARAGHCHGVLSTMPDCMCSDVAAKETMMLLLVDLLQHLNTVSPAADITNRALLGLVMTAVPRVEAAPELLRPAVSLLQLVLEKFGQRLVTSLADNSNPSAPYLTEWRTQLVANIKTVVQLSVHDARQGCGLVGAFVNSNLAEDGSVRRVTQALSVLLTTLDWMEGRQGSKRDRAEVVMAAKDVVLRAREQQWTRAGEAAVQCLASAPGQNSAALLCEHITSAVALAYGLESPFDTVVSSTDLGCARCNAGDVLEVVVLICGVVDRIGPTLRHAAGCLACLVMATEGAEISCLRQLVDKLAKPHQRIIVEVAYRTLVDEDSDVPLTDEDEVCLLTIVAHATTCLSPEMVEDVVRVLLGQNGHRRTLPSIRKSGVLLQVALSAQCAPGVVSDLLSLLVVDFMHMAPPRLLQAAVAYAAAHTKADLETIALSGCCGLVLMERVAMDNEMPSILCSPHVPEAAVALLVRAFANAANPSALAQFMWPSLHAHQSAIMLLFCVLTSVREAKLVRRWGPLLCELLLAMVASDVAEPLQARLDAAVLVLITVLARAPQARRLRDALCPVGRALAQTVAKAHPVEVRVSIQRLGEERALELRRFMEYAAAAV